MKIPRLGRSLGCRINRNFSVPHGGTYRDVFRVGQRSRSRCAHPSLRGITAGFARMEIARTASISPSPEAMAGRSPVSSVRSAPGPTIFGSFIPVKSNLGFRELTNAKGLEYEVRAIRRSRRARSAWFRPTASCMSALGGLPASDSRKRKMWCAVRSGNAPVALSTSGAQGEEVIQQLWRAVRGRRRVHDGRRYWAEATDDGLVVLR